MSLRYFNKFDKINEGTQMMLVPKTLKEEKYKIKSNKFAFTFIPEEGGFMSLQISERELQGIKRKFAVP